MQYKSLLVYSFYRISVILSSSGIWVLFADIDFLRCLVKYDLCQMFSSCEDMKIYHRDTNVFFTRIPWSFFLVANEKKPKIYLKNEALEFLILLEFSWLIMKFALKADIINMKLQNQLALDHNF